MKELRDRRGKTHREGRGAAAAAGRRTGARVREILAPARPASDAEAVRPLLRGAPGCLGGEDLPSAARAALRDDDADFDAKYRIFYEVVAPR